MNCWPSQTVTVTLDRDDYRCALCGAASAHGERGWDWSLQHRMARGAGGSRRWQTWSPANALVLCGSATTGCHHEVEHERSDAHREAGLWLRHEYRDGALRDPAEYPVTHAVHGRVLLDHVGGWSPVGSVFVA